MSDSNPSTPPKPTPPPPLSHNRISYLGWTMTLVFLVLIGILVVADILFFKNQPYNSLITYLVLPGFLVAGVGLILLGVGLEWRRRHKLTPQDYSRLPVVDLNKSWQRRRVAWAVALLTIFFGVSAIGSYHAYHFTESPVFCGLLCHKVMKPEYATYQHSPHARVSCAECHIGSGADWYVKAKLSGLRQVWAVATNSYELPIQVPVENLRPARETCEECHWPEKFSESLEKVKWHFSQDETNTPSRVNLLMKVGGGLPEAGLGRGIHWHINPKVQIRYWARDRQRMDIPWVEVRVDGQEPDIYRSADCPDPLPPEAEIRMMDCVDCHNRPAHIYKSPRQLIDNSLATNKLDRSLPYLKRYATQLFEETYKSTPLALVAIEETLMQRYAQLAKGPRGEELARRNIDWLQTLYQTNFFPEQKVDWRAYPNHQGHFEFPGCNRCHNNKHANKEGKVISKDCQLCHSMIDQAEGQAAFAPAEYHAGEFVHPRNMPDIWQDRMCWECHGIQPKSQELVAADKMGRE